MFDSDLGGLVRFFTVPTCPTPEICPTRQFRSSSTVTCLPPGCPRCGVGQGDWEDWKDWADVSNLKWQHHFILRDGNEVPNLGWRRQLLKNLTMYSSLAKALPPNLNLLATCKGCLELPQRRWLTLRWPPGDLRLWSLLAHLTQTHIDTTAAIQAWERVLPPNRLAVVWRKNLPSPPCNS